MCFRQKFNIRLVLSSGPFYADADQNENVLVEISNIRFHGNSYVEQSDVKYSNVHIIWYSQRIHFVHFAY